MKKLEPLKAGDQPDAELFRLMANSVQDYAIFLLDPAGHVSTWNIGARVIKQYEESEIVGKHFSTFYTDADKNRGWPQHELKLALETGRFEDEGWRVRRDGTRFWANVIITPLRDAAGELLAFSKITRDISERRSQEDSLRQSEERFRLLVEGVQDYAIYMLDVNGMVTSWNAGAKRIKGYESQEIIGQHFSKFYSLEDVAEGKPAAELSMALMHGRAEDEGWRLRKNGSRFWARVVVTALYDAKGTLRGFAKVTQDLTQRKHAEALELSRNNIHEFIAILAHELRNPLAPIRSAVHLMKAGGSAAQVEEVIGIVDRQSGQLMRIVDDILDVSRVTRGLLAVNKSRILVASLLERAVEAARPGIEAAGHTLLIDVAQAPQFIMGDEVRLAQAITNILNNACRYTPGGGTISVEVSVAGEAPRSTCVLTIKDNGQGIAPEFISSIFGMFIQGADKRSSSRAGLGVGLALARSIVELHEGTIRATSEGAGKGSQFVIEIPMPAPEVVQQQGATRQQEATQQQEAQPRQEPERQQPEPQTTTAAPAAEPTTALKILVVDDNRDAAVLLSSCLSALGHEVVTAYSGSEALAAFDQHLFQLVLLDIGMPDMDGLELARRIRLRAEGSGIFLVAVSGWGKAEDQLRSREAGIDLHLIKPVELEHLITLLSHPVLHSAARVKQVRQTTEKSTGEFMGEYMGEATAKRTAESTGEQQTEEPRALPVSAEPMPLQVLIVDDNVDSAQTTGWLVEAFGHRFSLAHSGTQALAMAEELLPDLILLDITLPDMNGYDVCRHLRKDPRFELTRIVAQTGRDKQSDRDEAMAAGFDHHLVKPLRIEDLSDLLQIQNSGSRRGVLNHDPLGGEVVGTRQQ